MTYLSIGQNIYIVVAIIGAILIAIFSYILFYKNYYTKRHFDRVIYRKLYRLAQYNDYLLLNNYRLEVSEKNYLSLNHVLITNKYIVLINDFYLRGIISGDYNDEQLTYHDKSGDKLILNPLTYNRNIMKRIALLNDLDNSFLKGLIVIEDDSVIEIFNLPAQFIVCTKKELKEKLKEIDSADVKPFKSNTVEDFIAKLDAINIKD